MKQIIEPERKVPVVRDADVVVVGGGPAGFVAAVAAARNGVRTLLVEGCGFLGGMATAALVGPFGLRDEERSRCRGNAQGVPGPAGSRGRCSQKPCGRTKRTSVTG